MIKAHGRRYVCPFMFRTLHSSAAYLLLDWYTQRMTAADKKKSALGVQQYICEDEPSREVQSLTLLGSTAVPRRLCP